jgi:hypothetical protein
MYISFAPMDFILVMSFLVVSMLRLFLNELLTAVVISWQPDVFLRSVIIFGLCSRGHFQVKSIIVAKCVTTGQQAEVLREVQLESLNPQEDRLHTTIKGPAASISDGPGIFYRGQ